MTNEIRKKIFLNRLQEISKPSEVHVITQSKTDPKGVDVTAAGPDTNRVNLVFDQADEIAEEIGMTPLPSTDGSYDNPETVVRSILYQELDTRPSSS